MTDEGSALPCVLLESGEKMSTVLRKDELDSFAGDQTKFEQALGKKLGPLLS